MGVTMTEENKKIAWNVFVRVLIEFVPPTAISALWAYYNSTPGKLAESGVFFSAAFIFVATFWLSLLRIHHQISTKVHQEKIAGGMKDVDTQIKDLGVDIGVVQTTLATLTKKLDSLTPKLSDADTIEISNLVRTANNHIETANTKFDAIRSYQMKAEGGRFTITMPSE
jgi:hypothetical protein